MRTISPNTGTRISSFRDAVRSRDRRCVISGQRVVNADLDNWTGFEAAHVVPMAHQRHCINHGYDRCITIRRDSGETINSVQNGMLLGSAIHQLFDSYDLSINPDVRMGCILIGDIEADNYARTITRACSFPLMGKDLLANTWAKSFLITLNDLSISFCDGTSGRLF